MPCYSTADAAGTTYWLRTHLVNSADRSWAEQGSPVQADATPVVRVLYAGVYRFAMFARNANGDGPASYLSDPVTVGERLLLKSLVCEQLRGFEATLGYCQLASLLRRFLECHHWLDRCWCTERGHPHLCRAKHTVHSYGEVILL